MSLYADVTLGSLKEVDSIQWAFREIWGGQAVLKQSLGILFGLSMVGATLLTGSGNYASAEPSNYCNGHEVTIVASGSTTKGTSKTDYIYVPDGVTTKVYAGAGDDSICSDSFGAEIFAGTGNDWIYGVGILRGDAGDDWIYSDGYIQGDGHVEAYGGAGNDYINVDNGEYVDGGSGNDEIYTNYVPKTHGGSGNDEIYAIHGDTAFGDSGNDFVVGSSTSTIDCGGGQDWYAFYGTIAQVRRCEYLD